MPFSASPRLRGEASRGFTIVELLVAMFIALIIFGIGFTILNGAVLARSDAQSRIQANDSARLFFEMLERDAADAYPGPWTPPFTLADLVQSGPPAVINGDSLTLTTTGESATAGVQKIMSLRYYILAATGQLYRQTQMDDPTAPRPFASAPPQDNNFALFPNARSLTVDYFRWNESTKTMDPALILDDATHLKVTLALLLPNVKLPDRIRIYSKYVPIAESFGN